MIMTPLRSLTTTNQIRVDIKLQPGHTESILASPIMALPMEELRLPGPEPRMTF